MADNEGEPPAQAAAEEQAAEGTEQAPPPQEGETTTSAEAEATPAEQPAGEQSEATAEEEPGTEAAAEAVEAAEATEPPAAEAAEDTEAVPETTEQPATEGEAKPEGEAGEGAGESAAPVEEQGEVAAKEGEGEGEEGEKTEGEGAEPKEAPEGETAEGEEGKKEGEEGEGGEGEVKAEGEGEAKPEGEGEGKPEGEDGGEGGEGAAAVVEGGEGEEKAKAEGEEGEKHAEGEEEGAKSPVPQSETFAEGERPESQTAVQVGEKLSRSPTPTEMDKDHEGRPEVLEPGTPERMGSEADLTRSGNLEVHAEEPEPEEEEEEHPMYDRDELIERYHAALGDREVLLQQNYQLQHKLAEYFRKKKNDERQDYDKNVTDQEQRYLKYMAQLDELHHQDLLERENYQRQMEELKGRCEDRRARVDDERSGFVEFKKQVALNSINSRSGKPIAPKDIEQYLITENKKETEVVNVRLENIKLKNKLKKKEQQLKSKEELAEGLHLIDFEQLKIENQTYNEKIEERNEELLKLRKKITSTVQVLTHLKEKLQFVQAENLIHKAKLQEVEGTVGQKRDVLSRTKQARDSLRIDNQRLRQNCGLLGNEPLLRDFEERKDEGDDLKSRLDSLKMQHAELTLNCNQVRRKIEQARNVRQ
ncbi:uncharacterized protein LOC143292562 [Babylonia areolata]|uniref:uncharacterized protein LOC143292562 n=1 Tax=Babylonia areolata TaxID=304850 RepID=UPI003FD5563C